MSRHSERKTRFSSKRSKLDAACQRDGEPRRWESTHVTDKEPMMMKMMIAALCAASSLAISLPARAADADACPIQGKASPQDIVSTCAMRRAQALVASGKIDKSWQAVKPATLEQLDGQRGKEWKVTLKNAAVPDKSKSTLYIFFTANGDFIASNFTGSK